MPLYHYDAPTSPFVGTIGELMGRAGQIQAQGALDQGNAQAQAQRANGQVWGGAVQQIAQTVAKVPEQIDADKIEELKRQQLSQQVQAGGLELKNLRSIDASKTALEQQLMDPSNVKADGTIDTDLVGSKLQRANVGAWQQWSSINAGIKKSALDYQKEAVALQGSKLDVDEKQRKAQENQQNAIGELAYHTLNEINKSPDDPSNAMQSLQAGLAAGAAHGFYSADDAHKAYDALSQTGSLDELRSRLGALVPETMRAKLDKEAADTRKSNAEAAKNESEAQGGGLPKSVDSQVIQLYGKQKQGVPLSPQEQQFLSGWETKEGSKTYTWKGVVNGKNVEQVMTTADAMKKGMTQQSLPASVIINPPGGGPQLPTWATDASRPAGDMANKFDPSTRFTPNGLYQAAMSYIDTGTFPPSGRGNDAPAQAKRAAIESKVGAIAAASGMDVPTLRASYQANKASLVGLQKNTDAAQALMSTADKNAELLKPILANIPDTGSPLFNKPLRNFVESVAGDPTMSKLGVYLQSVQNEYGKLITQPSLSGVLTDSARHEASQLIKADATVGQMLASIEALNTEGNNRIQSLGEQLQRITARIQTPGGNGSAPAGSPQQMAIPGIPGGVAEMRNGKWIRIK